MRHAIAAACLAVLGLQGAFAETTISVGGTSMAIPDPDGFARLTQDMQPAYQLRQTFVAPTNVNFAVYLPSKAADAARGGEVPQYERHLAIESALMTLSLDVTPSIFGEIRDTVRSQNDALIEQMRAEIPELFESMSDHLSNAFDADMAIEMSRLVPFEAHEYTADSYAFSALSTNDLTLPDGTNERLVVSMTTTLMHVKNRMLFIYVYGSKNDLEWTRDISRNWTEAIRVANR